MRSNDVLKVVVAMSLASSIAGCGDDTESNGGSGSGGGGTTVASTSVGPSSSSSTAPSTASSASSTATSSASGEGGNDEGGGGSGSGGDPGVGGAGGDGGAGGAEPASVRLGGVIVRHFERNEPDDVRVLDGVQGFFYDVAGPLDCTRIDEGACWFEHCHTSGGITFQPYSVGTLSIEGTTPELDLEQDAGGYYGYEAAGPMFEPGDAIGVVAPGDELPGFSFDLFAPAVADITSPSMGALTIDRSEDLDLAWNVEGDAEGLASEIQVRILDVRNADSYEVRCIFPMAAGAASIPSEFLAEMPDNDDDPAGILVEDAAHETVEVDGWQLEASVLRTSLSSEAASGLAQANVTWE